MKNCNPTLPNPVLYLLIQMPLTPLCIVGNINPLMFDITFIKGVTLCCTLYGKAIVNGSYGNSITNLQAFFLFKFKSKFSMITILI